LAGSDNGITARTRQDAVEALTNTKQGANQHRWKTAAKDKAFITLLPQVIIETKGETILKVLQMGTVSTNVFLRRLHYFCLDMNWLPWPFIPKRHWPAVRFKDKRAITLEEHSQIVARKKNPERKAFYQLTWHLGASQSDLAHFQAEDVDWPARIICFFRMKTRGRNQTPPQISFGREVEAILETLPMTGSLFPYLATVRPGDRATEFKQRCAGPGHSGGDLTQLPLCVGGTGQDGGLSRTIRANGFGAQQQEMGAGLFQEGASDAAALGGIRAEDCAAECRYDCHTGTGGKEGACRWRIRKGERHT
jgi:hypothetical protein